MKGTEATVELFANEDVDTVFTLASEEIIELLSEMQENWADQFQIIECRHEQLAALMADGYSRRGEIGVCIVGRGPAIAQTGSALKAADNHGSDVLYLVPETRRTAEHDGKWFQQESYLRIMAGRVKSIRSPDVLLSSLADAFRQIHAGKGPIAVQVPIDVLVGEVPEQSVPEDYDTRVVKKQDVRVQPDEAKIEEAIDAYLDADATEAPVILAGRGAVQADAKETIETLAEQMNAYLITSIQARGFFSDHPYYLGFSGDLGTQIANEYLNKTGFVLALGCSLNDHTVDKGHLLREDANVVHVDTNPTAIGEYTNVSVGVIGDVKVTTEAILDRLGNFGINRSGEFWTDQVRKRIAQSSSVSSQTSNDRPGRIDPRDLIQSLDELLPDNRVAVIDVGHFVGWVFDELSIDCPKKQIWAADFLTLGQALPIGIGTALAETKETCVVFCGDGGLMMNLQGLETAARYDVPLIVVVVNDDALGAEYHMGQKRGYTGSIGKVQSPDFSALAENFGAEGYTVRSIADVEDVVGELTSDIGGPIVLDCKVDPEARHPTMGEMEID